MESLIQDTIESRVQSVLAKIRSAAERAGRPTGTVRLVAATKTVGIEQIAEGVRAGLSILGENRVQEALTKIPVFNRGPVQWHFIGQLQRRKVRSVVGMFDLIHSVDSPELAQEIDRRAGDAGQQQDVLLEVNIGNEPTKAGFLPDDVPQIVSGLASLSHICIKGLMAIPPPIADPDSARPYFRKLSELAKMIDAQHLPSVKMEELSMGMSNDYEVAIEEGATLVRVGTAIFGARHV
ncbi:MAG: YggS family pyridoxal phosphate-dependent enzyme [Nitrospira sp.]|nr:YggS family pyridoxal phosphate-dependent enzyme [Nitrospira sp.]MDH5193054.1 YggS family pyridoxal phosphate-dependent enzyme [Nitrospira sp.]